MVAGASHGLRGRAVTALLAQDADVAPRFAGASRGHLPLARGLGVLAPRRALPPSAAVLGSRACSAHAAFGVPCARLTPTTRACGSPAGSALARGWARLRSVRSPLHPAGSLRRPEVLSRSRDPLRGQHHRGRQAARRGAERQLQPGEVLRRPEEQRRQQLPPAVLAVRQPPPAVRRRPGAPAEHRCGGRGLWLARSAARRQGASLSGRLFGEFRFPGRVLHAPGPASLLLRNQMHLLSLRVLSAGVQLRDYVEFSCCRCQNAGGKNLWMPGRTRAHTRERGAACRAEAGPSLPAQRWAGIHHLAAGGGAKEAECAGPRSQGACGPGSYWWTEGGHRAGAQAVRRVQNEVGIQAGLCPGNRCG